MEAKGHAFLTLAPTRHELSISTSIYFTSEGKVQSPMGYVMWVSGPVCRRWAKRSLLWHCIN